jgi:hypothetical protein
MTNTIKLVTNVAIKVAKSSYKMLVLFFPSFTKLNFWTDFGKTAKCKSSRKYVQTEPSCSMRADRETDR